MTKDEFIAWLDGMTVNKLNLSPTDLMEVRHKLKSIENDWGQTYPINDNWMPVYTDNQDFKYGKITNMRY